MDNEVLLDDENVRLSKLYKFLW